MKKLLFIAFILTAKFNFAQTNDKTTSKETNKEEIFEIVEQMPEFPGGQDAMMQYVQSNLKYPQTAKNKEIQGKVYIEFVVSRTGEIVDVKVLRGVTGAPELEEEAVRVIKAMPKWNPGVQNGKTVPVYFKLPISFTLKKP